MTDEHEDTGSPVVEAPKKAAKGIKGLLTKKVGPLPMGAWIIGIGGGLIVAAWLRRAYGGGDSAAPAADGMVESDYAAPGLGGAALSEPGYQGSGSIEDDAPIEDTPIGTNNAWRKAAINLAGSFGVTGLFASRAVDLFLKGKRLNAKQTTFINSVIAELGAPPTPTPVPPPTTSPAGGGHGGGSGGGSGGGTGGGGAPATNAEWKAKAIKKLVANGWNKGVVDEALTRFLAGKSLDTKQRNIRDAAIQHAGSPPKTPKPAAHKPTGAGIGDTGMVNAHTTTSRRDSGTGITPHTNGR